MLVLSRKIGEKINVGDSITIEVRRISGNRAQLAVSAPREVRVLRGEIVNALLAENGLDQITEESHESGQASAPAGG